jgi:hypothetical protein
MSDDIDNYCTDYDLLTKKIGDKEGICNKLNDSPEKLNGALLLQILKSQEQSGRENRELTYSTIVLSYTATILALSSLGYTIWIESKLPVVLLWIITLVLIIGGDLYIYREYQKKTMTENYCHHHTHAIEIAWLITISGAVIAVIGAIIMLFLGLTLLIDLGLPMFICGASFVVASKTLIYQDNATDKMEQRLEVLEKKIDLLLKREQP